MLSPCEHPHVHRLLCSVGWGWLQSLKAGTTRRIYRQMKQKGMKILPAKPHALCSPSLLSLDYSVLVLGQESSSPHIIASKGYVMLGSTKASADLLIC